MEAREEAWELPEEVCSVRMVVLWAMHALLLLVRRGDSARDEL
jgi:hypothetical protein